MFHTQIVSSCLEAMQHGHLTIAQEFMTDDFVFSGALPSPVNKAQWLVLQGAIARAFPVCSFNLHDVNENGDMLTAKVSIVGVHSGDLEFPGLDPIGPSYKSVVLPEEPITVTFIGDKISKMEFEQIPEVELKLILNRIGAHVGAHT